MPSSNSLSVLFILACSGSHCLMAPAAAGGFRVFDPATVFTYDYESSVLFNEVQPGQGKDVGFQISGKLSVEAVWKSSSLTPDALLLVKLENAKLSIKSRKAPAPEGFVTHSSKLDELKNNPFLVHWSNGQVKSIYVNQNEEISMVNLKKGIAGLFQFQLTNQEVSEIDASGLCTVQYTILDRYMIEKIKTKCSSQEDLPFIKHPDKLWNAAVSSKRRSITVLSQDLRTLESVQSEEQHQLVIPLREEIGGIVASKQRIKLQDRSSGTSSIQESTVDAVVKAVEQSKGLSFTKHSLSLTKESNMCADGTCPSFFSTAKENRDALKSENLGTIRSATTFIKLLKVARESNKEDLIKALKNSKNKSILLQLMDVMGATQTLVSHEAAIKVLNFKSEDSLDLNERYLWSLSLGSHPVREVIEDLVKIMNKGPYNEKLDETLLLTIAAMTSKLRKNDEIQSKKTVDDVLKVFTDKLSGCSPAEDSCCLKYLRAFKNLGAPGSIPTLLTYATSANKKISVAAIDAVHAFPKENWSAEVIQTAKKMYFQLDKRYDSSARTIALDILLENNVEESLLVELLPSLRRVDAAYEVRQYMLQRLNQFGDSNSSISTLVPSVMRSLNMMNYNVLGQKGLSTAFTRSFMRHPSANGSLSTVQEMSGGIVKRGLVDVTISKEDSSQSIFTLGLFAGGLGSFLSSDESNVEEDEEPEEETAIAGMDLTVMGVQVRPFVFFNGQGELMGHVWSGTASEKTPAFQALALLQDHLEFIPLETGFLAEHSLHGGISFDLSGHISLSIWNRNAESLVEKSAGLSVMGLIRVNTMFVQSQVQFNIATEGSLQLLSNIDFSSEIALCLRLQQPDSVIKYNVHKVERIPGSKHRLRKSKYKVISVSGRTYALNQKNNELCNVIFSE